MPGGPTRPLVQESNLGREGTSLALGGVVCVRFWNDLCTGMGGKKRENTPQHEVLPSQSKGVPNFLLWLQKGTQTEPFGYHFGHQYPQTGTNPPQNDSKTGWETGREGM